LILLALVVAVRMRNPEQMVAVVVVKVVEATPAVVVVKVFLARLAW
jgi:hypothetical protein